MRILHLFLDDLRLRDLLPARLSAGTLAGAVILPTGTRPCPFRENLLLHLKELFLRRGGILAIREGEGRIEFLRLLGEVRPDRITWTRPRRPETAGLLQELLRESANLGIERHGYDDLPTRSRYPLIDEYGRPLTDFRRFFDQWLDEREMPLQTDMGTLLSYPDPSNWQPLPGLHLPRDGRSALRRALRLLPRIGDLRREFADGGTGLSPWLVHGAVSRRELVEAVLRAAMVPGQGVQGSILLRRVARGEFVRHLARACPDAFAGAHVDPRYWNVALDRDRDRLERWQEGRTGIPLVDAAMRQMSATRRLSHLLRLAVAVVLVQVFHQDWRFGDAWFRETLDDYDRELSCWHWQRIAGSGFREGRGPLTLAVEQLGRELDPECRFIRRWLREWRKRPAGEIHLANHRGGPGGQTLRQCQAAYARKLREAGMDLPESVGKP